MVPMMVTPDQVAGVHSATHGMQTPYPFMPPHMSPAAGFMPQMHQHQQAQPPSATGTSHAAGASQLPLPQPAPAAASAPVPKLHAAPNQPPNVSLAPAAPSAPQHIPMMPPNGFPMMTPSNTGGFFFNNSKLPAHPNPLPMPNFMIPSAVPPTNSLQQQFAAAAAAAAAAASSSAGRAGPTCHPQQSSLSHQAPALHTQMPHRTQPAPQSQAPHQHNQSAVGPPTQSLTEQQKQQEQECPAPTSPSLQGGRGPNQFPPPPPGGAPGGSSGGSGSNGAGANGGGGGNLAHCA